MNAPQDIFVPDLGEFEDVEIIEVHAQAGDTVAAEDPLITLESDKAAMEVPSPVAGSVTEMLVAVGDKVSTGTLIARVVASEASVRVCRRRLQKHRQTRLPRRRPPSRSATPARWTRKRKLSCSAPGRAATRQRFAPPTWD